MQERRMLELIISIVVILLSLLLIYTRREHAPGAPKKIHEIEPGKYPSEMITVEAKSNEPLQVGIIGESQGDLKSGEAFNAVVLEHLLQVLKRHQVQAVFTTGNMVTARNKASQPDSWVLKQQLHDFLQLYKSVMPKTPLFPTMGNVEAAAAETSQHFRETFGLGNGKAFDATAFAYTVSIGRAFFAVIPTNTVNISTREVEEGFSTQMLDWLDQVLKDAKQKYSYLFVIGNEPAFLPTVTFPDKQTPQRDAFWQVLSDNGVIAYFSSHKQLYDRTNRYGVWQIVSGGGGSPYTEGRRDKPFFHCLVLKIPASDNKVPSIEVLDDNGNIKDEFDLTSEGSLLRQLHISLLSPRD